jgi:hypothetical protein
MNNHGRTIAFGALLALATASLLACTLDTAEAPLGAAEQRAISQPLPSNLNLVLNAASTVTIGELAGITGDVGSTGLTGSVVFGINSKQGLGNDVLANSVNVKAGASVGNVFSNNITLGGTDASQTLGLDPSALPAVPSATTAVPGTTNVTVSAGGSKQLCAGQYDAISVGINSTLGLNGGVYQVSTLHLADGAHLEASEPVVILVAGNVTLGTGAVIAPSPVLVNPMSAGNIRVEVGGNVTIGASSKVTAHLLVPGGKLSTGNSATLTGAGWASVISIGASSLVQGQGTFSLVTPSVPPACNDNNPCTVDECVGGGTSSGFCHSTPSPDGTTCTGNGVCEGGVCTTCGNGVCDAGESCSSCPSDCGACPACPATQLGSTVPLTVAGSTVGLTNTLTPSCTFSNAPEATFGFTAPATGTYQINTFGSTFDTVLYVQDATCGGPPLACDDDAGGTLQSEVQVTLAAGQTVVIVVDGFATSSGNFTLNIL